MIWFAACLVVVMFVVGGINLFRYLRSPESVRTEEERDADAQKYGF